MPARTNSDDGIRFSSTGNPVIDHWTWHIPTEDAGHFDSPGARHVFRVEYFDKTGLAQLQLFIEPEPAN